jgi:DNA phosphorothioation-dependent restriction protein DptG
MLKMRKTIVINTGPLIALVAGFGDLSILQKIYDRVIVPYEVTKEMLAKDTEGYDAKAFTRNEWLDKREKTIDIAPFLANTLDKGEASVIQTALNEHIETVCIDEAAGRRIARLNNLKVTGSLGITIASIKEGENIEIKEIINNMKKRGIWVSDELKNKAIELAENAMEKRD